MGCGDGTLLEHLYCVVRTQTARGSVLDKHSPCCLSELTSTKVARRITKQRLRYARIPGTIWSSGGDINRPGPVSGSDLEALGHDIHNLLHVRSFLITQSPLFAARKLCQRNPGPGLPVGAFAHPWGRRLIRRTGRKPGSTSSPLGPLCGQVRPAHPRASYFATGTYCCKFG